MSSSPIAIAPVDDAADTKAFVDVAYALNRSDPNWVPPLKTEVHGLIDPRTNPWFEHAEARLFLAEREGEPVGRISAQVDQEVLQYMGPGSASGACSRRPTPRWLPSSSPAPRISFAGGG